MSSPNQPRRPTPAPRLSSTASYSRRNRTSSPPLLPSVGVLPAENGRRSRYPSINEVRQSATRDMGSLREGLTTALHPALHPQARRAWVDPRARGGATCAPARSTCGGGPNGGRTIDGRGSIDADNGNRLPPLPFGDCDDNDDPSKDPDEGEQDRGRLQYIINYATAVLQIFILYALLTWLRGPSHSRRSPLRGHDAAASPAVVPAFSTVQDIMAFADDASLDSPRRGPQKGEIVDDKRHRDNGGSSTPDLKKTEEHSDQPRKLTQANSIDPKTTSDKPSVEEEHNPKKGVTVPAATGGVKDPKTKQEEKKRVLAALRKEEERFRSELLKLEMKLEKTEMKTLELMTDLRQ